MRHFAASPASERLKWLIDGLPMHFLPGRGRSFDPHRKTRAKGPLFRGPMTPAERARARLPS
jgi:hypothetical protein